MVIDSAEATAAALAVLLEVDGLSAPTDHAAVHLLQTTGDVDAFQGATTRLFGRSPSGVQRVELGAAVPESVPAATVGAPR